MIVKLHFLLFFVCGYTKTIRSRIYTDGNGTKELIFADGSEVKQGDVDFLLKSLNLTNDVRINLPATENTTVEEKSEERTTITNENILMQHWNSLTEVGWKNFSQPIKKMYLNSTRILRLSPEFKSEGEVNETSTETAEVAPSDPESPTTAFDLCQSVIDISQVLRPQTYPEHLLRCLTSKNETLLQIVEESLGKDENVTCLEEAGADEGQGGSVESSRTLLRPRRFLHRVLLPLLVVIVIKYLVTLPFVAVSVFTLNAMWLGLLSLGAVLFARLKAHDNSSKFPHRRLNPIPGSEFFEYGGPVTGSEIYWSPVRIPVAHSDITPH